MSGQHTPGPWEPVKGLVEDDEYRCGVCAVRGDRSYLVATIENGAPGDICDTEFANAHLIAAAPELLEALIAVRENNRKGVTGQAARDAWGAVNAAINKARGQ